MGDTGDGDCDECMLLVVEVERMSSLSTLLLIFLEISPGVHAPCLESREMATDEIATSTTLN